MRSARSLLNEPALLDELRAGSEAAFDVIFRTFYARLVHFSRFIVGEPAVAEEVVQDVMLKIWRHRQRMTIESSLAAYLFRATRNRSLNVVRHENTAQRAAALVAPAGFTAAVGERQAEQSELMAALQLAIATLPPRCREVFELSRVQGLKYAEIAVVMNISVKTVEAHMGKALRRLRERMTPWSPACR